MDRQVGKRLAALGAVGLFLVAALEVVIMISPFAFFFYSVFNPIFQFLSRYSLTRWTTAFFLPHMILPPTLFLQGVRVLGSLFFILGLGVFIVCALQVYLGKIFKSGVANRGFYRYVRHPQYLGLGVWGIGMAILWPRFIVLVTLSIMFILYHFLAKDEEKRMLAKYGASYEKYMAVSGMFFPRQMEQPLSSLFNRILSPSLKYVAVPVMILTLVLGTGFLLREITLYSLPLSARDNLTTVPILPEDSNISGKVIKVIGDTSASGTIPFLQKDRSYLGYVMPVDYIMQGMIADTGGHHHLFKKHNTLVLIMDWVLHPFAHLRRPPAAHMAAAHGVNPETARRHHCPLNINEAGMECESCTYRRVVFVEVSGASTDPLAGVEMFSLGVWKKPAGYVDLNTRTGEIVQARKVPSSGTAWRDVPTPDI